MDGNNSKFTIEEHSMREIGMKRDTQRTKRYASVAMNAQIACPKAQEAPGELSIVLVSHGLPP